MAESASYAELLVVASWYKGIDIMKTTRFQAAVYRLIDLTDAGDIKWTHHGQATFQCNLFVNDQQFRLVCDHWNGTLHTLYNDGVKGFTFPDCEQEVKLLGAAILEKVEPLQELLKALEKACQEGS